MDLELRLATPDDLDDVFALRAQAFAVPAHEREQWLREVQPEPETVLCAFDHQTMVGTVRSIPFGQWFGGRCLPMGGLASVVVAPEARGRGVAPRMLAATLERLRDQEVPISTLHPATVKLYRGAGWEIAGDFAQVRVPTRSLGRLHRGEPDRLRRLTRTDWSLVQECYERTAPAHPGWVHRSSRWWERLAEIRTADQHYVYGVDGNDGLLAGYVTFTQERPPDLWGYALEVDELVACTPDAGATLWTSLGAHSMQAESVVLPGALVDDLMLLLSEHDVRPVRSNPWMHRLVDVGSALSGRGWPERVAGEVHLQVTDPLAAWNTGRFVLRVEGSEAAVERGGTGEVQLGIGALSALAAGRFPARTLAAAGLLHHADPTTLATLDAMFAAPRPHLFDDF